MGGLLNVIGNPEWCRDQEFVSLESRLTNQDRLDQLVSDWASTKEAEDTMIRMQEAGVPASIVSQGKDLYESEHLKARVSIVRLLFIWPNARGRPMNGMVKKGLLPQTHQSCQSHLWTMVITATLVKIMTTSSKKYWVYPKQK
ncbi:MAG: hypothetical protein Ct9H300mP11_03830 [Chloroflexota bacterium]|nr:MAG: hypothetical protein Ct9H300mP11_03830 [Chloroflexota bacterium]